MDALVTVDGCVEEPDVAVGEFAICQRIRSGMLKEKIFEQGDCVTGWLVNSRAIRIHPPLSAGPHIFQIVC